MLHRLLKKMDGMSTRGSTVFAKVVAKCLGVHVGAGSKFAGVPIFDRGGGGAIVLGKRISAVSRSRSTALGVNQRVILRCLTPTAVITVGDDTGMSGTVICAAESVTIGARCLIGANVAIFDTDFHPIAYRHRRYAKPNWPEISRSVCIEDDVFIGTRAIITKGVTIGRGSIIAAGSVVTKDVPPHTIAAGNPARSVRAIDLDKE